MTPRYSLPLIETQSLICNGCVEDKLANGPKHVLSLSNFVKARVYTKRIQVSPGIFNGIRSKSLQNKRISYVSKLKKKQQQQQNKIQNLGTPQTRLDGFGKIYPKTKWDLFQVSGLCVGRHLMLVHKKETVESFHESDKKEVYIKNNFGAQLLFTSAYELRP